MEKKVALGGFSESEQQEGEKGGGYVRLQLLGCQSWRVGSSIDSFHRPGWEGSAGGGNLRPSHAAAGLDGSVDGERQAIEELSRGGFRRPREERGPEGEGGCWWTWGR